MNEFEFTSKPRLTPQDQPGAIPSSVLEESGSYALYVRDTVASGMREYSSVFPNVEIGGVLFGRHYRSGKRTIVALDHFYAIDSDDNGPAHYTFGRTAIQQIHALPQTQNCYRVGWFHSHPNFGDPFMSSDDLRVHRTLFSEPWYVSCVIGGGQWSLPLGFWRMEGDLLIPIENHFIMMTSGARRPATDAAARNLGHRSRGDIGEQNRRFVRACTGDRPLEELVIRMQAAAKILGEPAQSDLAVVVGSIARSDMQLEGVASPLAFAGLLAEAVASIACNPDALIAIKRLAQAVAPIRFFGDTCLPIFHAADAGVRLAWSGTSFCMIQNQRTAIGIGILDTHSLVLLQFSQSSPLVDICFDADGAVWIAEEEGQITRILPGNLISGLTAVSAAQGVKIEQMLKVSNAPVRELHIHKNSLLVLARVSIHHFVLQSRPNKTQIWTESRVIPISPESKLVRKYNGAQAGLIDKESSQIHYRQDVFASPSTYRLPDGLKDYTLVEACVCILGLAVLLNSPQADAIVVYDPADGAIRCMLIPESSSLLRIVAIAAAATGHLFINHGADIACVSLSGSLLDAMHHPDVHLRKY